MNTVVIEPIRKDFLVAASQETAFKVFTEQIDTWWPYTHHVGTSNMSETVLEPRLDGRWYSKHEDGSEANVGHVLAWDPYALLVLAWQVNGDFKFDPDLISEVEVQFIAESPKQTRVRFEHRDLEKLGGGTKIIDSMDEGWGMILNLYKNVAENES
jgi:uncharacterized protein YndB with AHSA1/START domain